MDGLFTQRRTDNHIGNDMYLGIHLTGLKHVGKVSGFFDGEVACDGRLAAFDLVVHIRSGVNLVVKDDCYLLSYVLTGDACPVAGTFGVHAHRNLVTAELVIVGGCVAHSFAVESGLTAVGTEGVESETEIMLVIFLVNTHGRLNSPAETKVGGKNIFCGCCGENLVDGRHCFCIGSVTYGCTITCTLLEKAHQRSGVNGGVVGKTVDECAECVGKLFRTVCLIEFEVCGTLQEVAYTFVVLDTGKFQKNLAVFTLKYLDVGRYNAELVDTVAEDVGCGVVHTVLNLAFEGGTYSIVAHTGGNNILKEDRKVGLRFGLTIKLNKTAYEIIALVACNHFVGTGQSGFESGVRGA